MGIFNRSHYEDVLVVRVRKLVPKKVWKPRYEQINEFERALVKNNVVLLKFFPDISKEEQKEATSLPVCQVRGHGWQTCLAMESLTAIQVMDSLMASLPVCQGPRSSAHEVGDESTSRRDRLQLFQDLRRHLARALALGILAAAQEVAAAAAA
jgi:hypothetical protein